ncbi:hypothetical protein KKH27_00260 [bacterium]|nr:hypothetical protein [bacterium]MBU1983518.1 hypothetical protein [bacterium]
MRTLIAIFLISVTSVSAPAQSPFLSTTLGTRAGAFSARSMALGHTYVTDQPGPAALLGNPATLSAQETQWLVDVSADVTRVKETRKYPVYDSFDAVLIYNNYAINDHLYSKLDGGASWRAIDGAEGSLVLAAASYSAYRFDYRYHEEVRDRYASGGIQDRRLGENRIDVDGDLRCLSLGAAVSESESFAWGIGMALYYGEWTNTTGVYYADPDSTNRVERVDYRPRGLPTEMNLGALWAINQRVSMGTRILLPMGFEVESNPESQETFGVRYPARYTLGVRYRPQSEFRPILLLEGEIITYRDVSNDLDNTFEIRAGAEQEVVAGTPVRLGFVYANAPEDKDRATSLFTAGIGFHLQRLTGDFAVELGKVNTTSPDLFPQSLYGDTDRSDNDKVETALFRGMITLRYAL